MLKCPHKAQSPCSPTHPRLTNLGGGVSDLARRIGSQQEEGKLLLFSVHPSLLPQEEAFFPKLSSLALSFGLPSTHLITRGRRASSPVELICQRDAERAIARGKILISVYGTMSSAATKRVPGSNPAGPNSPKKHRMETVPASTNGDNPASVSWENLHYQVGFGNHHHSEALKGALPAHNNPQKVC